MAETPKKTEFNLDTVYQDASHWVITRGPSFLLGLVVLFVGLWVIRKMLSWSQSRMHQKEVDPSLKPFLISLIGVILRVILILAVMSIMGIEMTIFASIVAALGVAAGLALSGTLQNFASGILILLLKPFAVGDNIITQGIEGTVTSIQIFYTIVLTFDNRTVIVPNGQLSNQVIVNTSREGTRRLDINLKFPNAVEISDVKRVISETLKNCKDCLQSPEQRIGVGEIQADGYLVSVNVWVNAHGFHDTRLKLQEDLLEDLKKSGIKLPGL